MKRAEEALSDTRWVSLDRQLRYLEAQLDTFIRLSPAHKRRDQAQVIVDLTRQVEEMQMRLARRERQRSNYSLERREGRG